MANFFSNLFSRKSTSVVGVDVGSSSIKVVQLSQNNGQPVLESYGELALGPYAGTEVGRATNLAPEKIAEALRDVLRESKITAQSAGMAIPFGSSLITSIEMPAANQKQFDQMIPIEARKYIPVPIAEVALNWWILPKPAPEKTATPNPDEKVDVLLVAIHNETLNKYQTIINDAGLSTSFFEIEIFSSIRSMADQDPNSQMIIDLGAYSSKIYVVDGGIVRASHVVNRGAQDITLGLSKLINQSFQNTETIKRDMSQIPHASAADATKLISTSLDYIFNEAHEVLVNYQRKYGKNVSKAFLIGGGAMLKGIISYAEDRLKIKAVLGDPFGKTNAPAFLADILKTTGPEFTVAVGTALRKLSETT